MTRENEREMEQEIARVMCFSESVCISERVGVHECVRISQDRKRKNKRVRGLRVCKCAPYACMRV